MSRYKPTKKSFIIAAMVILLCLVSITGATFALFTSTTEDGKIGINATSGNLKVDIIDASDNPSSLVGDVLDFITTSDNQEILFEPGAMYYTEGFRVKNDGSIPLNYIVYISGDDALDEKLEVSFADAFEVWITPDPTSRSSMVKLQEFDGRLEVGQTSEVYYLVFRMKETADNDFQDRTFNYYKDNVFYGIGITVCAVQGNGYIE